MEMRSRRRPPVVFPRGASRLSGALWAAWLLSPAWASAAEAPGAARAAYALPKIAHVFFAQHHVQAPDSPYFKLVGNLETLVKVHVNGVKGSLAPDVRARLALGSNALDLALKGPGLLPGPIAGNPVLLEHTYDNGFTAFIPREWIKTGLKATIELRSRNVSGGGALLDSTAYDPLPVGAPTRLILTMFDFHFFGGAQGADYPAGWFEELGSKLPVAELELRRVRNIVLDSLVMPPRDGKPAARCGSREEYQKKTGIGFDGEQGVTGMWNGALKAAAGAGWGGTRRLYYSNIYGVPCGGQAGGLSGVGNGNSVGILLHELGHALGLPHWAGVKDYPYVGPMHGIPASSPDAPHVGPTWGFDPATRVFLPPTHGGTYSHDPMQGGGLNRAGGPHLMAFFSDYSVSRIRECLEKTQVVWDERAGCYMEWNQSDGAYATRARQRGGPNGPVEDDIDVISVLASASLVTPEANIVYSPIGPYKAGCREGYKGLSPLCLRITQGGNVKTCPVETGLQPGGDPGDPKAFAAIAVNLPARDGTVTQADLLHAPGGKVLASWKAAAAPEQKTRFVTALVPPWSATGGAKADLKNGPPAPDRGVPPPGAAPPAAGPGTPPQQKADPQRETSPAKASGAAAEATPPPRPVVTAAAVAAWDARLRDRARALVAEKKRLVFRVSALGAPATILSVADASVGVRMEGGGGVELSWSQLKPADKRSLAVGIADAEDQPGDHALAAFYLILDGDRARADDHLMRAGSQAADVRAAFGLKES